MSYIIDKLRVKVLLALAPVLLIAGMALAPSSAMATEVVPKGEEYTATAEDTVFISDNGNGLAVTCEEAEATGQVPPDGVGWEEPATVPPTANENPGGTVNGPVFSLEFRKNCRVPQLGNIPANVKTGESEEMYSLTAIGGTAAEGEALINVPGSDILIEVPGVPCNIVVPARGGAKPEEVPQPVAASAGGPYNNSTSELSVDSQIPFGGTCLGLGIKSVGVFYADGEEHGGIETSKFTLAGNEGGTIEILP